ncbi:MAG: hypothetical protein ACI9T7_000973 [Oleiphilaceae bacterium]|jgi:hypothetical protein
MKLYFALCSRAMGKHSNSGIVDITIAYADFKWVMRAKIRLSANLN